VERRQGGADRIDFASCCETRTPGEQSLDNAHPAADTDRALRRSAPSHLIEGKLMLTSAQTVRGDDDARAV
jgi:hypothetical protein